MDNYNAKGINLPKTQLGLAKMNKLLDAAEELFTTNGFHGTSISDICKKAGTAVGTFYIYFETKTDVYRYLMCELQARMDLELVRALDKTKSTSTLRDALLGADYGLAIQKTTECCFL